MVNHKNGIKTDNRVENLEWVTHKENTQHAYDTKLCDVSNRKKKIGAQVNQYTMNDVFIKKWESVNIVANAFNVGRKTISNVCCGKMKSSCGYKWKYDIPNICDFEGETWKQNSIIFDNYMMSTMGRIKNANGTIIKLHINNTGYYKTGLTTNNKSHSVYVHRVIAMCFIPNPNNLPLVNHKNGNKLDNRVENLEWITHQDNAKHANDTCLINRKTKKVIQMDLHDNIIKTWNSAKEATQFYNASKGTIQKVCSGRFMTALGYKWKYAD